MKSLFSIGIVCLSLSCFADFAGMVQYLKGEATGEEGRSLKSLDLLHFTESITLRSKSTLKIITPNRCVGIIYGPAQIKVPVLDENFDITARSLRWICPEGKSEIIIINKSPMQIQGEVFVDRDKYLLLNGSVGSNFVSQRGIYKNDELYISELNKLHRFNNRRPIPKESHPLPAEKLKIHSRWYIGPVFGGGGFAHADGRISRKNLGSNGIRATSNFLLADQSIIASVTFNEFREGKNGQRSLISGAENNNSRLNVLSLDLGWRYFHERSWSPFFKFGTGTTSLKVDYGKQGSYFISKKVDYLHLQLTAGIDKHFLQQTLGWGGLFVAAEFSFTQTIAVLEQKFENSTFPLPSELENINGQILINNLLFSFGGFLLF